MRACVSAVSILLLVLFYSPPFALSGEHTRIGAVAGGNATGEIPAFQGTKGLTCPEGYQKGDFLPNPYSKEKVLLRIDHKNVDQYKSRLSPGQVARLKKNKIFYMNIYPTHRNFDHPETYYLATEKNRKTCRLDKNNVLHGFNGGLPFPFPKNGVEAIWNVKKPWAGDDLITNDCRRIVSPTGKIRKSVWTTKILGYDGRLGTPLPNPEGVAGKMLTYYSYPADREGEASLSIWYVDDNKEQDAWVYIPTLHRVRRAPTFKGGMQLDGESTLDEMGFDFRDAVNEWNWKLLGRKEMYIPANNYEVWKVDAPDKEECLPGGVNPALIRYELHRVWALEGTPEKGQDHPYSKRVSYYDEDHWNAVAAERYDTRGRLWRMAEYFHCYNYCVKHRYVIGYYYLNLESGRYEVFGGCRKKNTKTNATDTGLSEKEFTVQELRKLGH